MKLSSVSLSTMTPSARAAKLSQKHKATGISRGFLIYPRYRREKKHNFFKRIPTQSLLVLPEYFHQKNQYVWGKRVGKGKVDCAPEVALPLLGYLKNRTVGIPSFLDCQRLQILKAEFCCHQSSLAQFNTKDGSSLLKGKCKNLSLQIYLYTFPLPKQKPREGKELQFHSEVN